MNNRWWQRCRLCGAYSCGTGQQGDVNASPIGQLPFFIENLRLTAGWRIARWMTRARMRRASEIVLRHPREPHGRRDLQGAPRLFLGFAAERAATDALLLAASGEFCITIAGEPFAHQLCRQFVDEGSAGALHGGASGRYRRGAPPTTKIEPRPGVDASRSARFTAVPRGSSVIACGCGASTRDAARWCSILGFLRFNYSAGGAGQRLSLSRALGP